MTIIEQLARELNRPAEHIENVVRLLDEGNTIPFIARYRKELHGSMDDTALRTLEERLAYLRNLTERKESVKASIAEQEKLTDELAAAIAAPIISEGDALGLVLFVENEGENHVGETEYKLAQTIASFLGRHMES